VGMHSIQTRTALALWHTWPAYVARFYVAEFWRNLPGPLWVKVLLACVGVLVILTPGGVDDYLFFVVLPRIGPAWRSYRARRAAA
jgi:hypothetical protein